MWSLPLEARNRGDAESGRGERIRTSGSCLPKAVLYQAELHPDALLPSAGRDASVGLTLAEAVGAVDMWGLEISLFAAIC